MLGLLFILWTICSLYIFILLYKKKMYLASISISALYFFIISWVVSIFYISSMRIGIIGHIKFFFEDSYKYFTELDKILFDLPFSVLISLILILVIVCIITLITIISSIIHIVRDTLLIKYSDILIKDRKIRYSDYIVYRKVFYLKRIWLKNCSIRN